MAKKIKMNQLGSVVKKYLDEYEGYVSEGVAQAAYQKAADMAVEELKKTSPKRTGEYAESWTSDDELGAKKSGVVVYSKKPHLPHLLENGHATRNGGRTDPIPHIKPVDDKIGDAVVEAIRRELE